MSHSSRIGRRGGGFALPGTTPSTAAFLAVVHLATVFLVAAPAPAAAQEPPAESGGPPHILLDGGLLRTWDGASTDLAPLPKWVTVRLGAPLATLSLRDGRLVLIMGKAESEPDKKRNKHDGAVLLLGWPGGGPADLGFKSQFVVAFEGMPLLATGTEERAWVYARAAGGTEPNGRAWIHEIDFHAGQVAESTFLPGSVRGLAVEPEGGRLFAGLDDRVLSLTTHPLVTSWHYRSPGPNGPLAMTPDGRILAAVRGAAVAIFDAREIAARTPTERRDRVDDATRVVTLDRPPQGLAFSDDGGLLALFESDRVLYLDPRSGARLGEEKVAGQDTADELRPLVFPGGGADLVVAALPSGAVAALPSPATPASSAPTPVAAAANDAPTTPAPAAPQKEPAAPPQGSPAAEPASPVVSPEAASTAPVPPPAPPPVPPAHPTEPAAGSEESTTAAAETATPTLEPVSPPAGPPTLSGHIAGVSGLVKGVVIYGPSSIIREFRRASVGADGNWSMPLPPPGTYRVVPIGDGSTPIPVRPGFLSITVEAGRAQAGLDFAAGPAS